MTLRARVARVAISVLALLWAAGAAAQAPNVTQVPTGPATIAHGRAGIVTLKFHVNTGFHINSHTPLSDLLLPTVLKLKAPADIGINSIEYPDGELVSFPFSPDEKLSLYTGDFLVKAKVRAMSPGLTGTYRVKGELKYQACNNRQCFPPKTAPVYFDVHFGGGKK